LGPISTYIRGISGDTDLHFERLALGPGDAVINCSNVAVTPEFLSSAAADPDQVRLIEMCARAGGDQSGYGLCELNRTPLVRGARHAHCPTPLAMAVSLALLPLAKNLLLNSPINISAEPASAAPGPSPTATWATFPSRKK
ncbi:MAG: hypothetical protein K2M12_02885, partial [Muribaculaceae bacterium]|nr:hypothetical protein [Muribaculaceae bacterium]